MTDTERSFMAAIIERPDDDIPRLVFADWLYSTRELALAALSDAIGKHAKGDNQ